MREYLNINTGNELSVKSSLNSLTDKESNIEEYRSSFFSLGVELSKILAPDIAEIPSNEIMLACASEDADWLAKGIEIGLNKGKTALSVFWCSRDLIYEDTDRKIEITPIIKSYEEPISHCRLLIIAKSIISSSCVVKTQLTRLIGKINPEKIAILSPVMYKDGIPNLIKEFPEEISKIFQFISFAIDDERTSSGEIIPGIGGMVYPRLGLGDINEKNSYTPAIVLERITNTAQSQQIARKLNHPTSAAT